MPLTFDPRHPASQPNAAGLTGARLPNSANPTDLIAATRHHQHPAVVYVIPDRTDRSATPAQLERMVALSLNREVVQFAQNNGYPPEWRREIAHAVVATALAHHTNPRLPLTMQELYGAGLEVQRRMLTEGYETIVARNHHLTISPNPPGILQHKLPPLHPPPGPLPAAPRLQPGMINYLTADGRSLQLSPQQLTAMIANNLGQEVRKFAAENGYPRGWEMNTAAAVMRRAAEVHGNNARPLSEAELRRAGAEVLERMRAEIKTPVVPRSGPVEL